MLVCEVLAELEGVIFQCDVDVECLHPADVVPRIERHLARSQERRSKANKIERALRLHIAELGSPRGTYIGDWNPAEGKVRLDPYLSPKIFSRLRGGV